MSNSSFTFRCPECRKLLAASRSRVGTVVICPKCQSDLVVPVPSEASEATNAGQYRSGDASSGPVQVGVSSGYRDPSAAAGVGGPPMFLPIKIEDDPLSLRPDAGARPNRVPDRSSSKEASSPAPPASGTNQTPSVPPSTSPTEAKSPAVATEPAIRPDTIVRDPAPRRSDVVLPRTAVLLWSFAMLIALILAFAAGLLAGHHVWPAPAAGAAAPPEVAPTPIVAGEE